MIIDFNRNNGGSGSGSTDLTNYWNSAVTEQHIESAASITYASGVSYTDAAIAGIDLSAYALSADVESLSAATAGKADAKIMVDFDHTSQAERASLYTTLKALYDGGSGSSINKLYDFFKTVNTWQGLKIDYYGFSGDTLVFGTVVSPENITDQVVYEQVMVIDAAGNVNVVTNSVGGGPDLSAYYTSAQTDAAISAATSGKADAANLSSANLGAQKFPKWNTDGIITGEVSQAFFPSYYYINGVRREPLFNRAVDANAKTYIYAPVSAGTAGDILMSSGSGAPVWVTPATINGSAITAGGNITIQGGGGAADPTTLKSVSEFNSGATMGDVQSKITVTPGLPPEVTFVTGNTYGDNHDQFGGTLTIPSGFAAGTTSQDPVYLMTITAFNAEAFAYDVFLVKAYENEEHTGGVVLDVVFIPDDISVLEIPMYPDGGEWGTYDDCGTVIVNYEPGVQSEGNMVVEFYAGWDEDNNCPYTTDFDAHEESADYGLYAKTDDEWKNLTPNDVVRSSYVNYMWKGTQAHYNAISEKDPNTFYIIVSADTNNYDQLILTYEDDSTTAITLTSNTIEDYVYQGMNIKSVEVPGIVRLIRESAFFDNPNLESITLPEGLRLIGDYAFAGGIYSSITLPSTVAYIGANAFADNTSLESITLNEGLYTIGNDAFHHGIYSSITIPSTVTEIGENAFNIKDEQDNDEAGTITITCLATTPPTLKGNDKAELFGHQDKITAIYVPSDSVSAYQNDMMGWSAFAGLITAIQN